MPVTVVDVGIVHVRVGERGVTVTMGVRLRIRHRWIVRSVLMLMVLVMHVRMGVIHRLVRMLVFVALR